MDRIETARWWCTSMRPSIIAMLVVILVAVVGCSDDDDTGTGPGPTNPSFRDLTVNLDGMDTYLTHTMELRVLDASNRVVAVAILDSMSAEDATISMPNTLPAGTYHIDAFVDVDRDSLYDPLPTDHAWRVEIPSTGIVDLTLDTNFTDIGANHTTPGEDLSVTMTYLLFDVGKSLEMRVSDSTTKQLVGLFRTSAIDWNAIPVVLPGIAQTGRTYQVDIFVDVNDNGQYDDPPADNSWRIYTDADADGVDTIFVHNEDYVDVDF